MRFDPPDYPPTDRPSPADGRRPHPNFWNADLARQWSSIHRRRTLRDQHQRHWALDAGYVSGRSAPPRPVRRPPA